MQVGYTIRKIQNGKDKPIKHNTENIYRKTPIENLWIVNCKSKNTIRNRRIGKYTSGKYKSEDASRKIQFGKYKPGNTNRKIKIGKYTSEMPFGKYNSNKYYSEYTAHKIHIGKYTSENTSRTTQVRKYKSETTRPKIQSEGTNRKNIRKSTNRCNLPHCNIANPPAGGGGKKALWNTRPRFGINQIWNKAPGFGIKRESSFGILLSRFGINPFRIWNTLKPGFGILESLVLEYKCLFVLLEWGVGAIEGKGV